jgi:hypothetical protein
LRSTASAAARGADFFRPGFHAQAPSREGACLLL